MLLLRLIKGLAKGLVIGLLIGWMVAAAGFSNMGALVAYPAAAAAGAFMSLVAGKAIWEKGARLEVGMKALAGALLLGPGLMWVVRRFATFALPFDPSMIPGVGVVDGATLGTFALSSLALVAAIVGGFFDADNSAEAPAADANAAPAHDKKRIESAAGRIASESISEQAADELQRDQMRR